MAGIAVVGIGMMACIGSSVAAVTLRGQEEKPDVVDNIGADSGADDSGADDSGADSPPPPDPINCVGSWSGWSTCNTTCGGGTHTRSWTTTTQPQHGGAACPSPDTESQPCNTQACTNDTCSGGCSNTTTSNNGKYNFVMQGDGNLVLYEGSTVHWASNTNGKGTTPYRLAMQNDGNLVIYDKNNSATWASNTNGKGNAPYRLVVQDDRNVVIYDADNSATWATNTYKPPPINCAGSWSGWSACNAPCGGGTATASWTTTTQPQHGGAACPSPSTKSHACNTQACPKNICREQCSSSLKSNNDKYNFVMQGDGNLVLYEGSTVHWASNTNGKGTTPYRLAMQNDGNLVIYDKNNSATWASNTNGKGNAPYRLVVQDDRNVVIYDADNSATWATNTYI